MDIDTILHIFKLAGHRVDRRREREIKRKSEIVRVEEGGRGRKPWR
jgi:hypothetical protein